MKHRIVFILTRLLPITLILFTDTAFGSVQPNGQIRADLAALFENAPLVQGYPYQHLLESASARYGLPLPLLLAVVRGESFFDPDAISSKGAVGLMQVMPPTAAGYGLNAEDLRDPGKNIDVGVRYLADLFARLQDPYLALGAYYCGPGGVKEEGSALRQDCDDYVRYIHTHLKAVLDRPGGQASLEGGEIQHSVIARFDNFLDAEAFQGYLIQKFTGTQFDLFRKEVPRPDHFRFEYQIISSTGSPEEKARICKAVEAVTGFSFCK